MFKAIVRTLRRFGEGMSIAISKMEEQDRIRAKERRIKEAAPYKRVKDGKYYIVSESRLLADFQILNSSWNEQYREGEGVRGHLYVTAEGHYFVLGFTYYKTDPRQDHPFKTLVQSSHLQQC